MISARTLTCCADRAASLFISGSQRSRTGQRAGAVRLRGRRDQWSGRVAAREKRVTLSGQGNKPGINPKSVTQFSEKVGSLACHAPLAIHLFAVPMKKRKTLNEHRCPSSQWTQRTACQD